MQYKMSHNFNPLLHLRGSSSKPGVEARSARGHGEYFELLTICRGLAAMLVVVSHCIRASEHDSSAKTVGWIIQFFDIGSFAVVVFLALSGVSLYLSNSHPRETGTNVRVRYLMQFYCKRICRIWPAFLASLLAYMIFREIFQSYYNGVTGHWIEAQFLTEYTFVDLVSYLFLLNNFFGTPELFNNAYWSLPIEFQYYLLFPFFMLVLRTSGTTLLVLVGLCVFLLQYSVDENHALLFTLAPAFIGGIVAAHIYQFTTITLPLRTTFLLCVTIVAIASGLTHLWYQKIPIPLLGDLWVQYVLLSVATVFLLLITDASTPAPARKALHFLGQISFSIYLLHNLFIGVIYLLLADFDGLSGTQKFLLIFPFTLFFTLVTSALSYKFIEKPFVKLGSILTHNANRPG